MNGLSRHANAIMAACAIITAATAVLAVAGIALQLRAADATSRAQSAREAYAAHLALAVANPAFAAPGNACGLIASAQGAAYTAYVDHLLYAAEQMVSVEIGWDATFQDALSPHATLLCSPGHENADSPALSLLLQGFRADICPDTPPCENLN
ncbi:MAG: hypothetical protein MUD11_14290 [Rhodobacteraceae bacterium]|jgi:hypothetical protein|nr:hypothetical protein [Paracoccaceae bacterium]